MKKKKSIIILSLSLFVVSLVSYIAFATGNNGEEKNPLDFTLFASNKIQFYGNGKSGGDVWANEFLGYFGSSFEVTGNRWSGNDITKSEVIWEGSFAWQNTAQTNNKNHYIVENKKEMPQIMNSLKENLKNDGNYTEIGENEAGKRKDLDFKDITDAELALEKSYIVSGNINGTVKGDLKNNLISEGNITINLNNYKNTADKQDTSKMKPVIIASNGNINISGTPVIVGSIYAPNGTVHFRGAGTYVVGSVVAKNIIVDGAGLYINDGERIVFKEDL